MIKAKRKDKNKVQKITGTINDNYYHPDVACAYPSFSKEEMENDAEKFLLCFLMLPEQLKKAKDTTGKSYLDLLHSVIFNILFENKVSFDNFGEIAFDAVNGIFFVGDVKLVFEPIASHTCPLE